MTSPPLHIVFDACGAGVLRQALVWLGRRDRVAAFVDDLGFGPINPPDPEVRVRWTAAALPQALYLDEFDNEGFWQAALSYRGPRIAWLSRRSPRNHAGFLEVLWRLGDAPCDVIDLTDTMIADEDGPGGPFAPRPAGYLGNFSADYIVDGRLLDEARPLTPEGRAAGRALWHRLREENAPFRVVNADLDLVSAPISVFDRLLLSLVREDRWQKAAKVIGQVLTGFEDEARFQTGDTVLSSRLKALADAGLVEAAGNLARIRHSEVRLPPRDGAVAADVITPPLAR